ncbi:hypothetical protein N657DRAFT_644179 [Parathielavia appendiculata]|uniref:Uncharacterized protein n=1 Tax=Parathielavia appendiculata TaxID=2587402 RepID=A0AAN6U2X1_9PEZI|nr:hypothetical protein N657DRAFT_644179 [Parathielavia appendiculata]
MSHHTPIIKGSSCNRGFTSAIKAITTDNILIIHEFIMSGQSNVGNSQVYEAGDQRNPKASEMGSGTRYHEGTAHAHKSNDSKDQRSLANRAAAEKSSEAEESQETALHKKDPTLPANQHGNKPSRGADIDAELQAEDKAILNKKGGQNMPGKNM